MLGLGKEKGRGRAEKASGLEDGKPMVGGSPHD